MKGQEEKSLRDAIARKGGAVFSLPVEGNLKHFRSGFLGEMDGGILVEAPDNQAELVQSVIESELDCVVAFKSGIYKIAFASRILKTVPQAESGSADAILVSFPQRIKTLQRRAHYRVKVPPGFNLAVRVWVIKDRAYIKDVPPRTQEITCEVVDVSIGGLGVRLTGKKGEAPKLTPEDRLRLQITAGERTLILEGLLRSGPSETKGIVFSTGIRFRRLEDHLAERQAIAQLNRIVSDLQREELRVQRQQPAA